MIDHFQAGRNELYFRTDKLLTHFYHGTSAPFTDLFSLVDRVEHFAAGNVFYQFLPLASIFPFTQMCFHCHQIRFTDIRISTGFHFIKKRHLSLYFKGRRLFGFCSIKFTGKEINLLPEEPNLLFQFFDLLFVLLLCIRHGLKTFLFLTGSFYHKTAGFSSIYKQSPDFGGAHFRTAFGCSGERPSSSPRSC